MNQGNEIQEEMSDKEEDNEVLKEVNEKEEDFEGVEEKRLKLSEEEPVSGEGTSKSSVELPTTSSNTFTATHRPTADKGFKGKNVSHIIPAITGLQQDHQRRMMPKNIRFSQDNIRATFSDGNTLPGTLKKLLEGSLSPENIEQVEVVWWDKEWYAYQGNRRLYLYKHLEEVGKVSTIPVIVRNLNELEVKKNFNNRLTTDTKGKTIEIRNSKVVKELEAVLLEARKSQTGQGNFSASATMPLFGPKHKPPAEVVKVVKEAISVLGQVDNKDEKKTSKAIEDVSRSLASMKSILCGGAEQEQLSLSTVAQLVQEIYNNDLLLFLIDNLNKIDFEGRKDVVMIFNNLMRWESDSEYPVLKHTRQNCQILESLMTGYKNQELALNCGVMLRECFRHEELAKMIMHSDEFYKFFDFVELSTFDISSDAFSTFKELLTRHKSLSAEFLVANYDKFFQQYHLLLNADKIYVTRREALKLLGELLVDGCNIAIMTRYITRPENLERAMKLLTDRSRDIQSEAFRVFKVFVANPEMPQSIQEVLLRNKDKLVDFFTKFQTERSDDEQFNDEKAYLIEQLKNMKPLEEMKPVEEH